MNEIINKVLSILKECNLNPSESQRENIDNLMETLPQDEYEEAEMIIQTSIMMSKSCA